MTDRFLDTVYAARTPEETRKIYDAWSKTYESEVAANGYATPARCAAALARALPAPDTPVLDFGCGTGLSGVALKAAGLSTIDGVDLSDGMLEEARSKGVYRNLDRIGPDDPIPANYMAIAAIGVIGAGAAPLSVLERIVAQLPKRGLVVFSFNDHTLEDPAYQGLVDHLTTQDIMIERFRESGPHLPGRNMTSVVYVLEKA